MAPRPSKRPSAFTPAVAAPSISSPKWGAQCARKRCAGTCNRFLPRILCEKGSQKKAGRKVGRPTDLPVEMPKALEPVVNLKIAKALGITVPPSIMLQANRVIE